MAIHVHHFEAPFLQINVVGGVGQPAEQSKKDTIQSVVVRFHFSGKLAQVQGVAQDG